jgi:hypothetical protein
LFDHKAIYGHIRFSFYGVTDTRLKPDPEGTALARLYDETRMARRFFLFENLTLPSLIAQTDRDFTTVIMSSDVMPDRFKERLSALAARLPGAVVDFSPWRTGDRAFRNHVRGAAGPLARSHSVHFRLDDDDALSVHYIARLRRITQHLSPSTHVSFPSGIMLFPKWRDTTEGTTILNKHLLPAMGLATVNGGSFHKNPFQMMHGSVWMRWPVVSDPGFVAYIRTQHSDNDTVANQARILAGLQVERGGRRGPQHAANVDAALAENFPFIDRDRLDGLLARCAAITGLQDLDPLA